MSRPAYLLSRGLDPVLAVFTGILAFRLAETNPRTAPPVGETLPELLRWKYDRWRAARAAKISDDENWEELAKKIEVEKA